ncbi:hypothetical protein [Bacillus sp. FJAT-29937]|uniref:hypothetical protein n=1 Tax=Bacillus sp. FJAT-29937 TaxID=1720553 RepID=UPI000831CD5B|nr:hypothetical protein [Bacillus sp. FJAT-29937]
MDIVRRLGDDFNFILFAGPVPYYIVQSKNILKQIPSMYIPFHGLGLLRALFKVQKVGDVCTFSFDTVNLDLLLETFRELELTENPKYIFEFNNNYDSKDLVEYHTSLYNDGKVKGTVTGIASCHKELIKRGVPCIKISPLRLVIRETLDKVKLKCDNLHNAGHQGSVGIINVNHYDEWTQEKQYQDIQRFNLQLEQLVFNFVKELDGQCIQTIPREFLFFTTRALIEKTTEGFTRPPSIFHKKTLPKEVTLNLGIGIGGTTNLAAHSAKIAVKNAQKAGGNCCFIVNEQQQIIGPLTSMRKSKILELRTTDSFLLSLAERTNLSTMTLRKIYHAIHQAGDEFTANEVASYMGLSVKSVQRFFRLLQKEKAIIVIGKEALQSRGKPRRIFRLKG